MQDVGLTIKAWWRSWIIRLAGFMAAVESLNVVLITVDTTGIDPKIMGALRLVILGAIVWNRLYSARQAVTVTAAMKPVEGKVIPPEQVAEMKAK